MPQMLLLSIDSELANIIEKEAFKTSSPSIGIENKEMGHCEYRKK
ncbi:hypothetical protein [Prochlorococcus marinus]|nr:hypothetical protein [Prochlorococcus marinus]